MMSLYAANYRSKSITKVITGGVLAVAVGGVIGAGVLLIAPQVIVTVPHYWGLEYLWLQCLGAI